MAAMKNIISALHAGVVRMAGERDEVLQYSVEDGQGLWDMHAFSC